MGKSGSDLVTATSEDGQRRLMLTSWDVCLTDWRERSRERTDDWQACFEVAELRGLACNDAIIDDDPVRDANLKQLIADAVKQVEGIGLGQHRRVGCGRITEGDTQSSFFRRENDWTSHRLQRAVKQMDKPLWLWFWENSSGFNAVQWVWTKCATS